MSQTIQNLTQVLYQTPKVGEILIGQLSAADSAQREAQLAQAKALREKAETVSPAARADGAFALEPDKAGRERASAGKKRRPRSASSAEEEPAETAVVDIRV